MLGEHEPEPQLTFFLPPVIPASAKRDLLQRLNRLINWNAFRELARPYFSTQGRPSVDPVVMVKMMVVGMLFGFTSDRRLVEECADSAAITEFLGYRPGEPLPVHASFTHWRQRLGPAFFRDALHLVVAQAQTLGMELSTGRTMDGTNVKAQAGKQGPIIEMPVAADPVEFVAQFFRGEVEPADPEQEKTIPVNLHDPEARLQRKKGETADYRYCASFSVCTETGLICDATATPREQAATAVDHVRHDPIGVTEVGLDGLYDAGEALRDLQAEGVTCYVPLTDHDRKHQLRKAEFTYHEADDEYECPAGQRLRHSRYDAKRRQHFYVARQTDCQNCPRHAECTPAKRRSLCRMDTELARAQAVRGGSRYAYFKRRRQINEHVNLLAKRDHGMRRARSVGLAAMRTQACLTAIAIDLKKMLRWTQRQWAQGPAVQVPVARRTPALAPGLFLARLVGRGRPRWPQRTALGSRPSAFHVQPA